MKASEKQTRQAQQPGYARAKETVRDVWAAWWAANGSAMPGVSAAYLTGVRARVREAVRAQERKAKRQAA